MNSHGTFRRHHAWTLTFLLAAWLCNPAFAKDKSYGELSTVVNVSALQPGKKAVVAILFDVNEGYHTQSHAPSSKDYEAFIVTLDPNAAFTTGEPDYPKVADHEYPALGKLNVYTGKVVVYIPIEMKGDAALGDIKLTGSIHYQACDDNVCFQPVTTKFEIPAKVVAASETVTPNQPEIFKRSTTQPAVTAPPPKKTETSWGDWFQKPWVVWPMTVILVLMALGMFGLFTFRLPLGVYTIEPKHDTYTGNFLFGILTAILSTPCTAPLFPGLLAWAVLQAKSGGRFVGVGVIAMVGVGMALPYLILSAFPELARKLPRTGPWSELVKQMMGFLIFAVAAYFAGQQLLAGNEFMWLVFAVAVVGGIFLVVRTRQLMPRPRPVIIACVIAAVTGYGTFSLASTLNRKSAVNWIHFSSDAALQEALKVARQQKKIALVKFTAKWCANCQYIEATVYNDPVALNAIAAAVYKDPVAHNVVASHGVVMLKADLTKDGAPGANLLDELNPGGGIPLTAIYSPGRDKPYTLKSIYRTPTLVAALDAAETGKPFNEDAKDMSTLWAFTIALLVGVIFNVMPCVLPVLPLKAIGFYEVSQHNRAKSFSFGVVFSLGIIATFAALALLVLPVAGK